MHPRKISPRLVLALFLVLSLAVLAPAPSARAAGAPTPAAGKPGPTTPGPVTVSLTFDDGYVNQLQVLPMLQSHGMKATFYIMSGVIGNASDYMTWDDVDTVAGYGEEIGGHTLDHKDLTRMSLVDAKHEICQDRYNLITHGFAPISFAYPMGSRNADVENLVNYCGYESGRGIKPGPESIPPLNKYNLRAAPTIRTGTTAADFEKWVTDAEASGGGWLIYIFHQVCTRCQSGYTVPPGELSTFLDWLQARASTKGTTVKTVNDVIGGAYRSMPSDWTPDP